MQPRFMFCWPHAEMGVASSDDLVDMMAGVNKEDLEQMESLYPTSALLHDGVILPGETRKVNGYNYSRIQNEGCYSLQVIKQCLNITSKYSPTSYLSQTCTGVLRM